VQASGFRFIGLHDEDYPPLLRECPDPPLGLYVNGSSSPTEIFSLRPMVAFVGTRDMSPYGKTWCRRLVEALSRTRNPPCIVSGLAFGVDITAHISALDLGLPTIAVLPCGIDDLYPAAHRKAAERIASSPGSALVTDYPPGTSPVAFTFVRRNRIIAGLAGCTVLVESKANGGGLITCRLADSYGREVFALPGRVDDARSAGCNALIRSRTAEAITGLPGLGEQLGLGRYSIRKKKDFCTMVSEYYGSRTDSSELGAICELAGIIAQRRGVDLEELCYLCGKPYNEVARIAVLLETDGFICTDLTGRCTINARKS
jgi:DNA processing protein